MPHGPLLPFGPDGAAASWQAWDGDETERVSIRWENEAWTVSIALDAARCECVLRVSPAWQVRQMLLFRDLDEPDLWLGTDGAGHWGEVSGAHRPDLDGGLDLTVGLGAFALTVPVRRLSEQVPVGDSAVAPLIAVDTDTLAAAPHKARYERLAARTWRIVHGGVTTDVEFDEHGLACDVPGEFRRLA